MIFFYRGLESQCRAAAHKTGTSWREYWPFLNDYIDLQSPQGLEALEEYLSKKYEEFARREDEERCREVEEDDNIFDMGELEFISKHNHSFLSASTSGTRETHSDITDNIIKHDPPSPVTTLSSNLNCLNLDKDREGGTLDSLEPHGSRVRRPSHEVKVSKNVLFKLRKHIFFKPTPPPRAKFVKLRKIEKYLLLFQL